MDAPSCDLGKKQLRYQNYCKETIHSDAELVDSAGRKLPVDCEIRLPIIWGEVSDIRLAIPHSAMPIRDFENPCYLASKLADTKLRIEMKDVWYRSLTHSVYPERQHGAALIGLTHIAGMTITQTVASLNNEFNIYVSAPDLFNQSTIFPDNERMLDDLSEFCCPQLGKVIIQRYWMRSRLEDIAGFVSRSGYLLKISVNNTQTPGDLLASAEPLLNLLSIFVRQKIVVLGWELISSDKHIRHWKNPLELSETTYVSIEPKQFMASESTLAAKMQAGLSAYYELDNQRMGFITKLTNCLRPTRKLHDSEWFMAMFRVLESIAHKAIPQRFVTQIETNAVSKLRELANTFRESNRDMHERISGFANKMESGNLPISEHICQLLTENCVAHRDLWPVDGKDGLVQIRHKLAHPGTHLVHRQGLAVATFHLFLLNERLVHHILELDYSDDEFHRGNDDWLQHRYIEGLRRIIFKPNC